MIDPRSIEKLASSLPKASPQIERALLLKMRPPKKLQAATAALAKRGFLACLPFAYFEQINSIVLRVVPGRALHECPVGICWGSVTEAMTIAPDLNRFVAGRMASIDMAHPARSISADIAQQILKFAAAYDGVSSAEAVLKAIPKVTVIAEPRIRRGQLWQAACPDEPLCQVIAGAWSHEGDQIGPWLDGLETSARMTDIALRLFVTYHARHETGLDITAEAWRLVEGDNVFDATYTGAVLGIDRGTVRDDALSLAVRWLQKKGFVAPRDRETLWRAALAYQEGPKYDGALHLQAASEFAERDPELAFRQAANAAMFFARATENAPKSAIAFAHELAHRANWVNVATLLEWSQS